MKWFLCLFQSVSCSTMQKSHYKSEATSVCSKSQQENSIQSAISVQWECPFTWKKWHNQSFLSFNISFSPDTQQGPDKLDQLSWLQEHLIRVCKLRIWTVSERCVCPFVVAVWTVSLLKWQQNIPTRIKDPSFAVPQVIQIDDFSIHQSDLLIQGSWKMSLEDEVLPPYLLKKLQVLRAVRNVAICCSLWIIYSVSTLGALLTAPQPAFLAHEHAK